MLGTVSVKLRPIRIAFLVDPKDKKAVLEAIEINSFLWGGIFNPIIPVMKRIPATWKKADEFITFKNTARTIASGYIDAYDPDYFVQLGNCDIKPLNLDKDRLISANDILAGVDSDGIPSYGVGLFELLRYFIDTELKFVRKRPLSIYFTDLDKKSQLFLASVFGKLPAKIDQALKEHFRDALDAKDQSIRVGKYAEFLNPSILFPRRLASFYIDSRASRRGLREGCIFFLDADNSYDIIDYWNLRAMAWPVIPVPRQSATADATKQLARDFIEERFGQSRYNPNIFYNTTIMKSRSVDEKEVQAFIRVSTSQPRRIPSRLSSSSNTGIHGYGTNGRVTRTVSKGVRSRLARPAMNSRKRTRESTPRPLIQSSSPVSAGGVNRDSQTSWTFISTEARNSWRRSYRPAPVSTW
jgi:hypothetical protein